MERKQRCLVPLDMRTVLESVARTSTGSTGAGSGVLTARRRLPAVGAGSFWRRFSRSQRARIIATCSSLSGVR